MARRRAMAVGGVLVALMATVVGPAGTGAVSAASSRVESAWTASFGTGGVNGRVTVRIVDHGTGSITLALRRLTASTSYAVSIRRGTCGALGTLVVTGGTVRASGSGSVSATRTMTLARAAAVRAAAVGTRRISIVIGAGSGARCATLAKSLAVSPQIWFGPLPPTTQPWRSFGGSTDYASLFAADAPWTRVAGRTHVFEFHPDAIDPKTSATVLRRMVTALKARDIAISIAFPPLLVKGCGVGVEGFAGGAAEVLPLIRRIASVGGSVRFISMDEPFDHAVLYSGPNACHWSAARVAREVAAFVRAVHAEFPAIRIGLVEPYRGPASVANMEDWLDAAETALGGPLPFFHLDVDWTTDWLAGTAALQASTRSRGIRFGLYYTAWPPATSDAEWFRGAQANILSYELDGAGPPDDVFFASWTDHPDRALPETGSTTMTHLIADYVRTRTSLVVDDVALTPVGGLSLEGRLMTRGGQPIAGARVDLTTIPRDGAYQVIQVDGTVPTGATGALVAVRVNREGPGPGAADVTFYETTYVQGTETANRVPHPRFDAGLEGWGVDGTAQTWVEPSDRQAGNQLRIVAAPAQDLGINSMAFPVTAGSTFRFSAGVRVPAASAGSAYVAVIWLAETETQRTIVGLAPARVSLGSATTDATGAFSLELGSIGSGAHEIRASYAGSSTCWPARADRTVAVP